MATIKLNPGELAEIAEQNVKDRRSSCLNDEEIRTILILELFYLDKLARDEFREREGI